MPYDTFDISSIPLTIQSVQTVNGCHQIIVCEDLMTKYLLSTKKRHVVKYRFMFIVFLGLDTSSQCSKEGTQRGSGASDKCRSLTVC
jgi:hypothetical protein